MAERNIYSDPQFPVYITDPSGRLALGSFYFPFTPTITVNSSTGYSGYDLTHTNFQQRAFSMSNNTEISLVAPVVARDPVEAFAVDRGARFFRAAMKMGFGDNDELKGFPPPILRLNAYGHFKNVPVLIRDFTHNLDNDVDYVESLGMRMPISSTFVLSLATTYSPKNVRENFTINDYASGNLRNKGYI